MQNKLGFFSLCRRLLLAALGVIGGCREDASSALRVGISPWPGYETLYVAQEMGFYREVGVEVRLVEFSSPMDTRRAYERGQIDVFAATVVEVLEARDRSERVPEIVQVIDYSDGADIILARPGFTPSTDLRGARVGLELPSVGVYMLARSLERQGLTLTDVERVSMDQSSLEASFRAGELDAVVTYPPTSIRLLRDTPATPVFSSAEIPHEIVDVIAVDAAVARRRADEVSALLDGFHRAVAFMREDPTRAAVIAARREGITAAELEDSLQHGLAFVLPGEQAEYFAPAGPLSRVIDQCDRVLRQSHQIVGRRQRQEILNPAFLSAGITR
ncbi:MAG: ABC transporter substrate-binding protein [Polyangiales bacterium]